MASNPSLATHEHGIRFNKTPNGLAPNEEDLERFHAATNDPFTKRMSDPSSPPGLAYAEEACRSAASLFHLEGVIAQDKQDDRVTIKPDSGGVLEAGLKKETNRLFRQACQIYLDAIDWPIEGTVAPKVLQIDYSHTYDIRTYEDWAQFKKDPRYLRERMELQSLNPVRIVPIPECLPFQCPEDMVPWCRALGVDRTLEHIEMLWFSARLRSQGKVPGGSDMESWARLVKEETDVKPGEVAAAAMFTLLPFYRS